MKTFTGIHQLSNDHYQKLDNETKGGKPIPDWWGGITTLAGTAVDEADEIIFNSKNLLHEFFNHKSDANKYLDATQQEDLEKEVI